jgi:MFS family permease
MSRSFPLWALVGLGATQIIGYGTLYYAFSVLVPDIAADLAVSEKWVFGAFSLALLLGSFAAPLAGRLADRHGAGRVMGIGSAAAALSLVLAACAPGAISFAAALGVMQVVSSTVLYATAFTAIVQAGGLSAQRSIVHLTLIAGFASSLFWPLTSWLHGVLTWRQVFLVFAALNLLICLPVHLGLGRLTASAIAETRASVPGDGGGTARGGSLLFGLMLAGFAIEGYALSAMLVHMVPLTQALGLGAAGLMVASLFGPAQVTSRLFNLLFGRNLSQAWLAVIAAAMLPLGLVILLATSPWLPGAIMFAICMGLGSGLTSIVGGTLPLELFGRTGYGKVMGWSTSAKQVTAAIAPFVMSASMAGLGVVPSLWTVMAIALIGMAALASIPLVLKSGSLAKSR